MLLGVVQIRSIPAAWKSGVLQGQSNDSFTPCKKPFWQLDGPQLIGAADVRLGKKTAGWGDPELSPSCFKAEEGNQHAGWRHRGLTVGRVEVLGLPA